MLTARQKLMLTTFAAASEGAEFSPVQAQKLFFVLDKNVALQIGGEQFNFEPYDYGPFDHAVYKELEELSRHGLIRIDHGSTPGARRYMLTPQGARAGSELMPSYRPEVRAYMASVADWVRRLSFSQLVAAIYKAYPEMKANSIFQD